MSNKNTEKLCFDFNSQALEVQVRESVIPQDST